MSISQNFPSTRPSLNLNFARSQKLDPRITFTRSSTATYTGGDGLIKSAATNTPRFDFNATTGDCLGLLVEESRSNLVTYSEDYSNNSFTSDILITTNTITAPDGNTTADTLTANINGGSNTCLVDKNFVSTVSTDYTYSVFLKAGTSSKSSPIIYFTGGTFRQAILEITWGATPSTVLTTTGGTTATSSLVSYPNGWYRAIITYNSGNNTGAVSRVYVRDNGTSNVSGQTVYAWGAQVEAGAFATSYIPTVASTVTRSADNASITGTNFSSFYNPSEGSVFVQAAPSTSAAYSGYLYSIGSDFNNSITAYRQSDYQPVVRIRSSSSDVYGALGFGAIWTTNTVRKVGLTFKTNSFNSAVSGTVSSDVTSGTLPSYSNLTIGSLSNGNYLNGTISQLLYYPVRLSNSQLQNLTK